MKARPVASFLLAVATAASGQTISGSPEIRRAIPVTPQSQEGVPASTPGEAFRPQPRPIATPAPQPDEEGSIRIAPSGSGPGRNEALALANSLYARKMYDLAVPEYERFLISSSGSEGRDAAMFRLAECHRMLSNMNAARAEYEKLVMEFQKGEFVGAGAYRLGEFLFGDKLYDAAHSQFQTAARESKDGEVRLTALYFSARSLDYLKKDDEALADYEEVLAVKGKNPYRDHAKMSSADIRVRTGKKDLALAAYEELAAQPGNSLMVAEAAVKAASVATELGKTEKALSLFQKVLASPDAGDWKSVAVIGTMRLRYQASNYKAVVEMAPAVEGLPATTRPEALQILAASHRKTGNNLDARRTYDRLLKEFPETQTAGDARFQRLVSLYALKDKNLVAEIDAFLEKTTDPKERTQALQLKAEALFKQADYAGAGKVFENLLTRELSDETRAESLYKLAWCLAATGNHSEAAPLYSEFLSKFPNHKLAPTALAQRALSKEGNKALDAALEDFEAIASKYPGTKEHELALQHQALILGQQKKYPEMVKTFDKLLAEFPKTAAAGQANFWLGWALFEQKDYKAAIAKLESARLLDPAQYAERATLRIILAHYYLEDRSAVARESEGYKGGNLPSEILLWLASKHVDDGSYAKAEALLLPLTANPAALPPDAWIQLADCQIRLGKFREALGPAEKYLASAREPATRARALLANARIRLGLMELSEAATAADEALMLQPEGRLNAEGRMLQGDILFAKSDFDGAARAYMTVSVLIEDPSITPRALQKASEAYQRANNRFESEKALTELRQRYPDFVKTPKPSKPKK